MVLVLVQFKPKSEEDGVEKFIARIEFEVEADALKDGGRRIRDLGAVAEPAGFRMIRGEVHPVPDSPETPDRPGWTGYGPKV